MSDVRERAEAVRREMIAAILGGESLIDVLVRFAESERIDAGKAAFERGMELMWAIIRGGPRDLTPEEIVYGEEIATRLRSPDQKGDTNA